MKPATTTSAAIGSAAPAEPVPILLIEDNPGDARLIQVMLADAGEGLFLVEQAGRLDEGLKRLERPGIALVLLDLSLPDSRGMDTFIRTQRKSPRTPIIVLSGHNDERMAVEAVHEGAQDYLVKGHVESLLLVRSIRYAIERKQIQDELERVARELKEKNDQMQADLNMAREIQQIFLPQQYPVFPPTATREQSALRFHHHYYPAEAVSGDFFNIFQISSTTAGVFICDVMGHGLRAALVTAVLRGLIEELMPMAADPGLFLTEINRSVRAILKRTDEPLLATAFYLVVDVESGTARFSNAGHPSPFQLKPGTGEVRLVQENDPRHGPVLGLFDAPDFPTCRFKVEEGDTFILFTDGLYEVESPEEQEFGPKRLRAAVERRVRLAPVELFKSLLSEINAFAGTESFSDDVCLVSMEVAKLNPGSWGEGRP